MAIAFVGDVHGCALHALAALIELRRRRGVQLEAVVQVGDLGAYRQPAQVDEPTRYYAEHNPAQADMFRVIDPDPGLADTLQQAMTELGSPVLFVAGNHEDHSWLDELHRDQPGPVPIDPVGVFAHVADGTVMHLSGVRVGFLGGADSPGAPWDLDDDAIDALRRAGAVDVLVTHDGPYGMSTNWRGEIQGSSRISALLADLQPRLHVSGHYHHPNGPRSYGRTTSYALALLVPSKANRWSGEPINPKQQVAPGSIALLHPDASFEYVADEWLKHIAGDRIDVSRFLR